MSTGFYLLDNPNRAYKQYRETRRNNARPSGVGVVHTGESLWSAGRPPLLRFIATRTTPGSYHHVSDFLGRTRMVPWAYETWHCTATNNHSTGFSAAVRAGDWNRIPQPQRDAIVRNMAAGAAEWATWLKATHGITVPARRITRAQALNRVPGFIGHGETDPGRRSDPGAQFNWSLFLSEYSRLMSTPGGGSTPPAPTPERTWLDMATKNDVKDALREVLAENSMDDGNQRVGVIDALRRLLILTRALPADVWRYLNPNVTDSQAYTHLRAGNRNAAQAAAGVLALEKAINDGREVNATDVATELAALMLPELTDVVRDSLPTDVPGVDPDEIAAAVSDRFAGLLAGTGE